MNVREGCKLQVAGRKILKPLVPAVLLLAAPAYAALENLGSQDQPVEITADSLEVIQPQHIATFSGNVRAVQGDVTLSASAMRVHYRDAEASGQALGAVARIEASGDVFLATPAETARGRRGVYDVDHKKVYLLQDVVLTRGENVLKGERLEYDFVTGRSLFTAPHTTTGGKPASGRVKARFTPEKK